MTYFDETNAVEETNDLPPFNREEWIRQKRAEREQAYQMISEQAELLPGDGERFKSCLDLMGRFSQLSVNNILLLECQKPDAKDLRGFDTWKDQKVSIKKGETGIMLFEAGKQYTRRDGTTATAYNVKRVFDVSQTDLPFAVSPIVRRDGHMLIRALVKYAPCRFEGAEASKLPRGRVAVYDQAANTVLALPGAGDDDLFREMALAVAYAHLSKSEYNSPAKDTIAVCTAYVLCVRNGIDTADFDFSKQPETLKDMDETQIKAVLAKIRSVANTISQDMEKHFEKLKEVPPRDDAR